MKEKTKNKVLEKILILGLPYLFISALDGAVYNYCQSRIEENNFFLNKYGDYTATLRQQNEELTKTRDMTRNNPFYFPFGLFYDLANKRI
jgi:CRISPR/Cas system CMR subunit Cmr6 (Cas7 group RAMP superfamily)